MIDVRDIRKCFGEVVAVDGVSFEARDGRITGLLGPNGAGKSTAIRIVTGLLAPDSGTAQVDGLDARRDGLRARSRLGILPDARGLYARLSARENVRYFGELAGLPRAALEARIDELFALLELSPHADRPVHGFSQGERMKVAIARAVVHGPQNVLLDEPTNGLDVMSIRSMRRFIRALAAEGRAVLFSSHVMQEVAALCDDVVVIGGGRVVAMGTPDEIRSQGGAASLEDAFVRLVSGAELGEVAR
ncbi:MAG: ATP-binding cassette domain-containing protein [Deltaproteobacteria bacterium]|nr:ATP-binding cassette domain-containing protein [Deltaproteobacteria bacterium]